MAKTNGSARRRIPFSVRAEGAKEVVLTGEFNEWATDKLRLKPKPNGTWTTQLTLPPGQYQYRLLIDGQWCDHADAERRLPNPYGTENCVLTVPPR